MGGCIALIVAAGRGLRFGGDIPKQYRVLGGRPVVAHAMAAFAGHAQVQSVRAVIHPDDAERYRGAAGNLALLPPVPGGASRQESVRLGLESLVSLNPDRVLIHDAARPYPGPALIGRVIDALDDSPGALPVLPITDTVKRGADGVVTGTVPRDGLWRAQTPQGFRFADILAAHRAAAAEDLTDDAAVAERSGLAVRLVAGDDDNLKVTTEDDLRRAGRRDEADETRTGYGYDVHRFCSGDHVMLCGIAVPHDAALAGHSDADVGLHAITDAVLGAIGAGDIGQHFPPSDDRWKGAESHVFLAHAAGLARDRGGVLVNIDVTLICERPRIGPHREAMVRRIADIAGIEAGRVNVKGTTTERLGFTGRREGIAAQAVATVRMPSRPS